MNYELMLILSPKLSDKENEKTLKEVKSTIKENGFELADEDIWGARPMAYKIKGYSEGYYVILTFTGEAAGTQELKRELRIQANLLRHLLVKMPDDYKLMRFDKPATLADKPRKLSKHAEELSKKVTSKKKAEPKKEEEPEKDENLDEKLQAIVDDADIDL